MKELLNKIINIGVKPNYLPWESSLTRKLNSISLIGIFNVATTVVFFAVSGYTQFITECVIILGLAPFVFVLNHYKNYIWSAYLFYAMAYVLFFFLNMKMGKDAYMTLYFFPVIISMVQLLGRRETLKHLIIIGAACFISIIVIVIGFKNYWLYENLAKDHISNLAIFNIVLSFFTAIAFIIVVVTESLSQERLIKSMLTEKEILLAEVFHRVKNNMNIVTSLLNLKKNMSDSSEVKEALEDCRSRVYSMALVHNKIFNKNNIVKLNFKDYINDLVKDVIASLGAQDEVEVNIEAEEVNLELSNAIPCGLILNELITNSFKYARTPGKKLVLTIKLCKEGKTIELLVKDNGPGLAEGAANKPNSLGVELIKSLSSQIDGEYSFLNNRGVEFRLIFKQV